MRVFLWGVSWVGGAWSASFYNPDAGRIRNSAKRDEIGPPRTGEVRGGHARSHLSQTQREFGPSTQHVGAVWQLAVSETNGAALARSIIAALG